MRVNKKYDLTEIVRRLTAARVSTPGEPVCFHAFDFDALIAVLESAIDFQSAIPDADRRGLLTKSATAAAGDHVITVDRLKAELGQAENAYLREPQQLFVVATSLGLRAFRPLKGAQIRGARIAFVGNLPPRISRAEIEDKIDAHLESAPVGLSQVTVTVRARTAWAAQFAAMESIDLLRAIWNFQFNRAVTMRHTLGPPRPVNKVLPGPTQTVHRLDGSLAMQTFWYETQPLNPHWVTNVDSGWVHTDSFAQSVRTRLNGITYREDIERALIRYTRALDSADHSLAFNRLWGVLEWLTNSIGSYDLLIARCTFLSEDSERAFDAVLLQHLRDVRNGLVHMDLSRSSMESYLFQLKWFTESALLFHLRNGKRFRSRALACEYLDTPQDVGLLRKRIQDYRRALTNRW